MKCPKCGKDMLLGAIFNGRGDARLNWVPKDFFDKHWFNSYNHTKKTIQEEGGMVIKGYNKFGDSDICYGCKECNLVVIDCKQEEK